MIRVKTRVFQAMKMERVSLQNKHAVIQQFITANKTKIKAKIKTLQEQHLAYEAIKI
jgi:hypothetical protein